MPAGANRAIVQINKTDAAAARSGSTTSTVTAAPNAQAGAWMPFHVADETENWLPIAASPEIVPGGALDVSFLVPKPAGRDGLVTVKEGRLNFGRRRPRPVPRRQPDAATAFLEPERADALADRLARSGINLVRLGDLDMPLGPGRSLFDDTRDDTKALDPEALARLDHLIAVLKERGIYVALELQWAGVSAAGTAWRRPACCPTAAARPQ